MLSCHHNETIAKDKDMGCSTHLQTNVPVTRDM